MAEYPEEYIYALTTALAQAKALPSAHGDLTVRILRDKPSDIGGYLQTLQAALPSYFLPVPETPPSEPVPGDEAYQNWFLQHAERIAGDPMLKTATAAKAEMSTGKGQTPQTIRKDDPQFNKLFVTHAADIASGTVEVV